MSKCRGMLRQISAMTLTNASDWVLVSFVQHLRATLHQILHSSVLSTSLHNAEEMVSMGYLWINGVCGCLGLGLLGPGNGAMV